MRKQDFHPPMYPDLVVCPRCGESARGRIGILDRKKRRYRSWECRKPFAETVGTPLYGLKHPAWIVTVIMVLLACGCPIQGVVMAFGVDERTVLAWQKRFGARGQAVQEQLVCQGQIDVGQVQGDELYAKTQCGPVWVATAVSVFSRLFLWGAASIERDEHLVRRVVR
jgi:transposase-like protein